MIPEHKIWLPQFYGNSFMRIYSYRTTKLGIMIFFQVNCWEHYEGWTGRYEEGFTISVRAM